MLENEVKLNPVREKDSGEMNKFISYAEFMLHGKWAMCSEMDITVLKNQSENVLIRMESYDRKKFIWAKLPLSSKVVVSDDIVKEQHNQAEDNSLNWLAELNETANFECSAEKAGGIIILNLT